VVYRVSLGPGQIADSRSGLSLCPVLRLLLFLFQNMLVT
jgi:hypothetical protein